MDKLDINQLSEILPQRYPFLLIDKVVELEDGERVVAVKNVTVTENFFQGHFPGNPVMPGTLIIEAMAQASIVLYHSGFKEELKQRPQYYLGSVKANFKHPVVPGDQLRIEGKMDKLLAQGAFVSLKAYVEDKLIAEAELVFAVKR